MTDEQLLELAAKAAGIDAEFHSEVGYGPEGMWLKGARSPDNSKYWNPLNNDGDALRLAMKLHISLDFRGTSESVPAHVYADLPKRKRWWADGRPTCVSVEYVPEEQWSTERQGDRRFADWYMQEYSQVVRGIESASRRAIVLAAASIAQAQGGA